MNLFSNPPCDRTSSSLISRPTLGMLSGRYLMINKQNHSNNETPIMKRLLGFTALLVASCNGTNGKSFITELVQSCRIRDGFHGICRDIQQWFFIR